MLDVTLTKNLVEAFENESRALVDDGYIKAATSHNTRMAYQSDINHFQKFGVELPSHPNSIEQYLKECAPKYNPRTLKRRIIALRQWHVLKGLEDPTKAPNVVKIMQGIARLHGVPKKQAAALRLKDLDQMMVHLNQLPSILNIRNRALLLVGFFGAFRRSELVSLEWDQVSFATDGIVIKLSRSKTDQTGQGADCVIPYGNDLRCPVRALIDWRKASGVFEGAIFRRINKTGTAHEVFFAYVTAFYNRAQMLRHQLAASIKKSHKVLVALQSVDCNVSSYQVVS